MREITLRSCVSVLWCAGFGYVFWQESIFNPYHTVFRYIEFGIIGSVFFHTLRLRGLRDAVPVLIVIYILVFIFVKRVRGIYFMADMLTMIFTAVAIYLFCVAFYDRAKSRRFAEPLVLGVLLAVGAILSGLVFMFVADIKISITLYQVYQLARDWFLVGLGIGIGIVLTEEPYATKCKRLFSFAPGIFSEHKGPV